MLTQVRGRGKIEVGGRKCEIKCEDEREIQKYPSIHPSRMLRVIFETYSAMMNNECREAKICVERYRHLEKRMGKSISFFSN